MLRLRNSTGLRKSRNDKKQVSNLPTLSARTQNVVSVGNEAFKQFFRKLFKIVRLGIVSTTNIYKNKVPKLIECALSGMYCQNGILKKINTTWDK